MFTVSGPTDRVVVVGAGLAGLSAAMRLAEQAARSSCWSGRTALADVPDAWRWVGTPSIPGRRS